MLLYSNQSEQSKSLNPRIFYSNPDDCYESYSESESSNHHKSDLYDSRSDNYLQADTDLEETINSLSAANTNSRFKLIEYSLMNGFIVVGYSLLNSTIKVTISFNNRLSDSNNHMSSMPSRGSSYLASRNQLMHQFSYKDITINGNSSSSLLFLAELMDNNPRVQGLMDLVRLKVNQLVLDIEMTKDGAHNNRLLKLLNMILVR